ncbi:tRNA epoxyqueuosine(34) reductase QueG [Azohydromonas caseinilytica]|uniref:Epoxyqueuosine reductase n=1 Tax=Azohydromonas caseinilytica TaxID=2728836 RepID=A0A848F9J1_9BURK|nr:tRNA epoxyqueuosine(34) reductase QueG [Azohydromonas caseinilytica]NML14681.1 tRNA epoxyqueuosine(34) reductase QueG [Azohydromonas caseinilytica]
MGLQGHEALALLEPLRGWARELGFSQIGISGVDLNDAEPGLRAWLEAGFHGGMHYMAAHGMKRARPAELVPGTVSVITARMDYLPRATPDGWQRIEFERLDQPLAAGVSMYARGRDYHKVLRARLQKLADRLAAAVGPFGHRVFTDSAPVLEVELATRAGLGWRGRHTLTLARDAGSTFFLGEIYVDLALPESEPASGHCGACSACVDACPTQAIVAPYRLDARRCISYLTIEHDGPIPVELRPLLDNRIYGCDDCQLVCPWNKFARRSPLPDFDVRAHFEAPTLLQLWGWSEAEFLSRTEGSPIRRIGFDRWQRNLAVALGNALRSGLGAADEAAVVQALRARREAAGELVREHIDWALAQAGAAAAEGLEAVA